MLVDFPFNSTTTITTITTSPLHLAPDHLAQAHRCPSPQYRDVGPLNGGTWEGKGVTKGGTQGMGGPVSAFSPFPLPSPPLTLKPEVTTTQTAGNG